MRDEKPRAPRASHRILGVIFVGVVAGVFATTHQLIVPIFLGLITWGKLRLKALSTLWNTLVPRAIRHRWYMYVKWKLGRQQVTAARRVYEKMSRNTSENA